ncbi:MAG: DNA recombination protein RmuC, partial [Candidatus Yanofskybacteria bacterium]|nr:DNA recombination protein RmuC [Candidatus Yanofskybacteria bacterium]
MQPILVVISILIVGLLGLNIWLTLRGKKEPGESILHQRLDSLTHLVSDQLERSRQSSERASLSVHQQVQQFTQGMTQLQETVKQVHESVRNVSSFQDIFKSPKLRGIWGEASLEAALGQYFSKDMYQMQYYFKSGEAVDAILRLPNETLLPIDSKFNWENFEKMTRAEDPMSQEMHRKQFLSDVKKKIDEIATKYILPSEGTMDMALMYVPAETVYYEIINNIKEVDVPQYARSKKVILVSPNTFALTVTAVLHWFRDVEMSKQTKEIM